MASGRRYPFPVPGLAGRPWPDVASQLQDYLRRLHDSEADGVPPGFNDRIPEPVEAGIGTGLGDPGTESLGWAAADHDHVATTGVPVALTAASTNDEGTDTALARADHTHDVSALSEDALVYAIIFGE